jgi:5'-3' exonuclease
MDDNGNHIGGTSGFLRSMGYAIRTLKPTRVIVVFDGKGGSQRRRKIFPEYKSQRKMPTRLNRPGDFKTPEQELENLKFQLVSLMEILSHMPVTTIQIENVEADDIIGYLAKHIEKNGGKSIIYSTDKDFLQLVNENVTIYSPIKKKTYTPDIIQEEYLTHPNNFVFYRALLGDKSDNINGISGAGAKTLHKYLPELTDPNSKVDYDFVVNKYKDVKKKPSVITKIINEQKLLDRNVQLMDLSEQQMSVDAKLKIIDKFNAPLNKLDKSSLTKAMVSGRVMSNFTNYDEWVTFSILPLMRFYDITRKTEVR